MNILCLTGITRVIDTPPKHPPGNGKIDAARIADSVPRLNGALPISYTQFPPKRKKNARTFVSASTSVPARAIIFRPLIVFKGHIFHRRTTRVSVTLASSSLARENFQNLSCRLSRNYVHFRLSCGKISMDFGSKYFSRVLLFLFVLFLFFFNTRHLKLRIIL